MSTQISKVEVVLKLQTIVQEMVARNKLIKKTKIKRITFVIVIDIATKKT
jgi:hypothetical protein